MSVTAEEEDGRTEILVSNIGFFFNFFYYIPHNLTLRRNGTTKCFSQDIASIKWVNRGGVFVALHCTLLL